jgi:hypothetical protein
VARLRFHSFKDHDVPPLKIDGSGGAYAWLIIYSIVYLTHQEHSTSFSQTQYIVVLTADFLKHVPRKETAVDFTMDYRFLTSVLRLVQPSRRGHICTDTGPPFWGTQYTRIGLLYTSMLSTFPNNLFHFICVSIRSSRMLTEYDRSGDGLRFRSGSFTD